MLGMVFFYKLQTMAWWFKSLPTLNPSMIIILPVHNLAILCRCESNTYEGTEEQGNIAEPCFLMDATLIKQVPQTLLCFTLKTLCRCPETVQWITTSDTTHTHAVGMAM